MRLASFLLFCVASTMGIFFAFNKHAYEPPRHFPTSMYTTPSAPLDNGSQTINSKGKLLFKNNCAQCHNKNMRDDLTGPALAGVRQRWEGRETELYIWIRNSQQLIAAEDPYAVELFNQWSRSVMIPFPNLSDEDITDLLAYIDRF